MSDNLWLAILTAAALLVSLYLAYITKHSVSAAEHSAIAAQRTADAAQQQADETRRANDLTEQTLRRGVRSPDATTESARAVGWEIERSSQASHRLRLRNVGEATAENLAVDVSSSFILIADPATYGGRSGPTVPPNGAVDISLTTAMGQYPPTFVLVSWDGVVTPVRVPIPPE